MSKTTYVDKVTHKLTLESKAVYLEFKLKVNLNN